LTVSLLSHRCKLSPGLMRYNSLGDRNRSRDGNL
jgi:hypothetical protein